jgi:hypothetical protein
MFYIDLQRFTNDLLYLGYNSAEQENLLSRIFHFQKPIRSQIDLRFLEHHSHRQKHPDPWKLTWRGMMAKRGQVARPARYGTPPRLFQPAIVSLP